MEPSVLPTTAFRRGKSKEVESDPRGNSDKFFYFLFAFSRPNGSPNEVILRTGDMVLE